MLFNSIEFLIFFPIVVILYFIIPKRVRYIWLLISSYYFYMSWNAQYAILILFATVVTYMGGLLIEKFGKKKIIVVVSIVLNLLMLFFFKYIGFAGSILRHIFSLVNIDLNIPQFDILLPVGISFYTFQALSYTIDVYRGETKAEHNFLRYALFVSFFPQLVAGPIERSKHLLGQLNNQKPFDYNRFRNGILIMIWGFFLKIVLADRIAIFVDFVYENCESYRGLYIVTASILFAVQIYCDFYGYSSIAVGAAKILGIDLTENFIAPYLAMSVSEFWRRWHISLTSWFRDYLYIPLGGSRKGRTRKYINEVIVFLISGLWHGAAITFVIWGGLNGIYQIIGDMLEPMRIRLVNFFRIRRDSFSHGVLRTAATFALIDFSWVFFRAGNIKAALNILRNMFSQMNPWIFFDGSIYGCGLDMNNFMLMMICIGILFIADICKLRGIVIHELIMKQDYWFRWLVVASGIFFISLFGVWGGEYNATNFIYFQF